MTDIYNACGPRIIDVTQCASLSRASIKGLTPQTIEDNKALGFMEANHLWRQMMLARMSGMRETPLADLIASRLKKRKLSPVTVGGVQSFFLPYIMERQKDFINSSAFTIHGGQPSPYAGGVAPDGTAIPANAWQLAIKKSPSKYSNVDTQLGRHFLKEEYIIVFNLGAAKEAQQPTMKVLHSQSVISGGLNLAIVEVEPPFTLGHWNTGMTGDERAVYQPTDGVVINGANSISNAESYCINQPVDMSSRVRDYWPQTMRFTRTWDDLCEEYLKYIFAGKVNPYLEMFKELPLVEQNKQMHARYMRTMMNTLFFGEAINENQTVEAYQSLPQVTTIDTSKFVQYKTNAVGIYNQLSACGRIVDMQGAALNMDNLNELLHNVKKQREVDSVGSSVDVIDVMGGRILFNYIASLMARYQQQKYNISWERNVQKTPVKFGDETLWNGAIFELEKVPVMLNYMIEEYFEDWRRHFATGEEHRANSLWFLDWQDIEIFTTGSARRQTKQPNIDDPAYKCVIDVPRTHHILESMSMAPAVHRPSRHLIIENIGEVCPTITADFCSPTTVS